jgi:hypothetical protein
VSFGRFQGVSKLPTVVALGCALAGCDAAHLPGFDAGQPDADLPNPNAVLASLGVSRGALEPPFNPATTSYTLTLGLDAEDLELTPTAQIPDGVTISVAEMTVESGATSAPLGLPLGDSAIEVLVTPQTGESVTYIIAVNRGRGILQDAYVKASNAEASDTFGRAIAIDGDTLAVGARLEDSGANGPGGGEIAQADNTAPSAGAVYVFVRGGDGAWTQQSYIKPSNPDSTDFFGHSLALSGDTLAVSALLEDSNAVGPGGGAAQQADNSATSAGAVYVFTRAGGVWSQESYIKASNTEAFDDFGQSVALDGDTLAVGAHFEDSGVAADQADNTASASGAVYVFTRSDTEWTQQAYLKASNLEANDQFGFAVSLDGDTLAVGALFEDSAATVINGDEADNTASAAGAVYVFTRSGATWTQQPYITASNTEANDRFGESIALSGDTLAVGAKEEDSAATGIGGDQADNTASSAGAVYVFTRSGTTWAQQAYLKASNTTALDDFGSALGLDGDTLAVGALFEDSAATGVNGDEADETAASAGAVYLFIRRDGAWSQIAYVKATNTESGDQFGFGVGLSGGALAIGSSSEDSAATGVGADQLDNSALSAGAVYVFR